MAIIYQIMKILTYYYKKSILTKITRNSMILLFAENF
jgi:hypothetical protein